MWEQVTEKCIAIVIYPFNGASILPAPHGQDLSLGDVLTVLQESPSLGWLRCTKSNNKPYLIPISYTYRTNKDTTSEITKVVREWNHIWRRLYVEGAEYQLHVIGKAIRELVEGRSQLLAGNLTREQSEELKLKLAGRIDWGNRKLGLDLVPRDGYKIVGPEVGVVQLYRVHVASVELSEAARTTLRKKKPAKVTQPAGHHLFMTVRDFNCNLGEDCEVYFSIYDAGRSLFISDRYGITLPASNSTFIDRLQTISTLFLDLCTHEFTQDLYIVTHILRLGRMFHTDSHKKSTQNYRRPLACGALHINNLESETSEFNYKLYTCDEKDYCNIHEYIIKHSSKVTLMGNNSISVALRLFHGDINAVMDENSVLLKGIVTTRKIGFPDVIMPGVEIRNDLYITISHGEFEKGGKTTGKNIAVSVQVLDSSGAPVENTVFGAVNMPNYESIILYHNNNPQWNEIIRVTVPIEAFQSAHIRILFRHCSTKEKNDKKLFGFSFIKLMDDNGTTIKDSSHSLPIYKTEDITKLHPRNYMNGNITFPRSTKETLYISTQLVSTKLTQNMDLVSLLKWKQHPEKVKQTLVNIAKLPGEELVKFLQDVLDVIFEMFIGEDGYSTDYSGDAFIVLINIFTLLEDSKFEHFKPVIHAYIHDHFAAALVYKGLLSSVRHYADVTSVTERNSLEKEFIKQIQKCFKTSEYIFKFIVQSRILFARATGGNMEDSFRRDVQDMFDSFYSLVSINLDTSEEFVSTQAALLLNLHKIYNNLGSVVPIEQLSGLIYKLFHSIPLNPSAHPLSPAKLTALGHLVASDLFAIKGPRQLLLPEICKHIRHHLSIRDELKLTSEILLTILHNLHNDRENHITPTEDDIETISSYNLENLINCVLILERTSSVITPLVTNLISLLQQMNEFHYNRIFDEFKDIHQIRNFILRALFVFRDLIKMDVFNPDWASMKLLNCSIILKSIHNFSNALSTYFIKPFDYALTLEYLNVCISFIIQPSLQLETFRDNKKCYILNCYGDMRVQMSREILDNWELIRNETFIPSIVGPLLQVTLIPENQLRNDTIPLFYDLLVAEWTKTGDFKEVEAELIDKLDTYILDGKGDEDYIQAFNSILTTRLQCLPAEQAFTQQYKKFIASITKLLEHSHDYRQVPNDIDNKDKKMQCTNNLLQFYKQEVDNKPMYIKYIYKLIELHVSSENYAEAGFTLLLHSDMIDWEEDYERKETIYLRAIQYFDNGKMWESGIPLCKELAIIYESKYDYAKLSNILIKQANYFNNIMTMHRPDPEYFRVGFFGCGFPLFVRNKEFIYRGLAAVRVHIKAKHKHQTWTCNVCSKEFAVHGNYLAHMASHDDPASCFCETCQMDFSRPAYKEMHEEKENSYHSRNVADLADESAFYESHPLPDDPLDFENEEVGTEPILNPPTHINGVQGKMIETEEDEEGTYGCVKKSEQHPCLGAHHRLFRAKRGFVRVGGRRVRVTVRHTCKSQNYVYCLRDRKSVKYYYFGKSTKVPVIRFRTYSYRIRKVSELRREREKVLGRFMNEGDDKYEYQKWISDLNAAYTKWRRAKANGESAKKPACRFYTRKDYERLATFMQKLLAEWPGAQILKNVPVDEATMNGDGQNIQIRSVKPLQNNPIILSAPFKIRSFYNTSNITHFQFDRPMNNKSDDENVKNMWVERTTLETISSLPGILRSCQVKSKTIIVLNPVSYACQRIMEVNKDLEVLVSQYTGDGTNGNSNVNQLSMRLQGILDASVMGGLPKYQEAFFNQEYIAANRDTVEDVTQLSKLINEQVEILDKALNLHGQIIPPGVQPLHNRLVECFNTMKTSVNSLHFTCPPPGILTRSDSLRINSSIINTPLPPLPNNNNISNSNSNSNINMINNNSPVNNNRISSGYGTITFHPNNSTQSDDEDVYSIPTTQPPPIPNRKKKRQINSVDNNYAIPPRPRKAEPNNRISTPPIPPDDPSSRDIRTPPPVPPKPGSESKRCSSNSTNSNSGSHKEYYILPKESPSKEKSDNN